MERSQEGRASSLLGVSSPHPFSTSDHACAADTGWAPHPPLGSTLPPYLVTQGFSWRRKPAEADLPGAESLGIGIQWCTQAAFGGLGDLAHASQWGDTIHHLCRHEEESTSVPVPREDGEEGNVPLPITAWPLMSEPLEALQKGISPSQGRETEAFSEDTPKPYSQLAQGSGADPPSPALLAASHNLPR